MTEDMNTTVLGVFGAGIYLLHYLTPMTSILKNEASRRMLKMKNLNEVYCTVTMNYYIQIRKYLSNGCFIILKNYDRYFTKKTRCGIQSDLFI